MIQRHPEHRDGQDSNDDEQLTSLVVSSQASSSNSIRHGLTTTWFLRTSLLAFCIVLAFVILSSKAKFNNNSSLAARTVKNKKCASDTSTMHTRTAVDRVGPSLARRHVRIEQQAANYRNGTALWFHFHITFTGGTTVLAMARNNGPVPTGAGGIWDPNFGTAPRPPWNYAQTDVGIARLRPVVHFLSLEPGRKRLSRSMNETNFDHPNLFSTIVVRNPLERVIKFKNEMGTTGINASWSEWLDTPFNHLFSSNFGLHNLLSGDGCCSGNETDNMFYHRAVEYSLRFTYILDLSCLTDNLNSMALSLNLTNVTDKWLLARGHLSHSKSNDTADSPRLLRERMGNDDIYMRLIRLNLQELRWYHWAKSSALVPCHREFVTRTDYATMAHGSSSMPPPPPPILDLSGLEEPLSDVLPFLQGMY